MESIARRSLGHSVIAHLFSINISQKEAGVIASWGNLNENPTMAIGSRTSRGSVSDVISFNGKSIPLPWMIPLERLMLEESLEQRSEDILEGVQQNQSNFAARCVVGTTTSKIDLMNV